MPTTVAVDAENCSYRIFCFYPTSFYPHLRISTMKRMVTLSDTEITSDMAHNALFLSVHVYTIHGPILSVMRAAGKMTPDQSSIIKKKLFEFVKEEQQ